MPDPTYRRIGDHTETVDIEFDPHKTSYETLLGYFWKWHSPTSSHSRQYMSAIFYHDQEQKKLAEQTRDEQQKHLARPIVTVITEAGPFYEAEDYHQKYILRQHQTVLDRLKLTDSELIKSKTACRLNGYLAGNGSEESFLEECDKFDLSESTLAYVQKQIRKKNS